MRIPLVMLILIRCKNNTIKDYEAVILPLITEHITKTNKVKIHIWSSN